MMLECVDDGSNGYFLRWIGSDHLKASIFNINFQMLGQILITEHQVVQYINCQSVTNIMIFFFFCLILKVHIIPYYI